MQSVNTIIKLRSLEINEKREDDTLIGQINKFDLGDFNLLIGDNAQGKTRLLRYIIFISSHSSNIPRLISTKFHAVLTFDVFKNDKNDGDIIYELNIEPKNGINIFSEIVKRNGAIILSTIEKKLYNETKNEEIINFYIPDNLSAIRSITEPDFITINLLREFFHGIMYISADKTRTIKITPDEIFPNEIGTNIASVLYNWKQRYPSIYNEVIEVFQECYPFINEIFFERKEIISGKITNLLAIKEDKINFEILQPDWSDGIYRVLCLLMLPRIPFNNISPSMILIDEIENGLDFKTLKFIIQYLKDYSDDSQIILTSHSPLVCEFIHPKNWKIVRRKGIELSLISPLTVEDDLDKQLDLFKQKHWEFYTRHISNSDLYTVK